MTTRGPVGLPSNDCTRQIAVVWQKRIAGESSMLDIVPIVLVPASRAAKGGIMDPKLSSYLRLLEGRQVNVALRDGTRIDDCNLVSAGRHRLNNLWLFIDGEDLFVARGDVVEVWSTADPLQAA